MSVNGQNVIYQMVTDRILASLEDAIKSGKKLPWNRPWNQAGAPRNAVSMKAYRGANVWILSLLGYGSPFWLSFKQVGELGGKIKKGEKGSPVVFWKFFSVEDEKEVDGVVTSRRKTIPFLRYYLVWNLEQTEGVKLPKKAAAYLEEAEGKKKEFQEKVEAESIWNNYQNAPTLKFGGDVAAYSPSKDEIYMPTKESFHGTDEYYGTLFHEMIHSTGHKSRLARAEVQSPLYGTQSYSREELVAELGAAMLKAVVGIENGNAEKNTVAYIQSWIDVLRNDIRMFVLAAGRANRAADYILGITHEESEEDKQTVESDDSAE